MKIVIVDDSVTLRRVLSELFESNGHHVIAALEDGSRLMACVMEQAPDLVCLDYHLPGQNGLELLKALQRLSLNIDTVIITGSNDPALARQATDAGACGFLHKPFQRSQILEELKHIEDARRHFLSAAAVLHPVAVGSHASNSSKRNAIIVDDSSTICIRLTSILTGVGLEVLSLAKNGKEGVSAAKKHMPAIVFLDVEMPHMSGLEALPMIIKASPASKVVMVTGNPSKHFVETAIGGGAVGYILKPFRPIQIEEIVNRLLGPGH